jgi:hypothetical protein
MSWVGASVDAYSNLNGQTDPFVNAASGDFRVKDNAGISILPGFKSMSLTAYKSIKTDAREMLRTSNTDATYDAGMYETGIYVPPQKDFYVDLAKTKSGLGIQASKWCVEDLKSWLSSSPFIDAKTVVHLSRTGELNITIPNVDFNINGSICFTSENTTSPSLAYSKTFSAVKGDYAEIPVVFKNVLIGSDNCSSVVNLPKAKVTSLNTAWSIHRSSKVTIVKLIQDIPASTTITVVGALGTKQVIEGTDWESSLSLDDTATSIAEALASVGFEVEAHGPYVELNDVLSFSSSSASSFSISTATSGIIAKDFVSAGSSFVEKSDIADSTNIIKAESASVDYSAFSGSTTTAKALMTVAEPVVSNSVKYLVQSTSNFSGPTMATSASPLFVNGYASFPEASDFVIASNTCKDVATESTLTIKLDGYKTDMLGRLRSKEYAGGNTSYDAGAIEFDFLTASSAFAQSADDALSYLTTAGIHLNARSKSGQVVFKVSGYVVGTGEYVFWDPTLVDRTNIIDGSQAKGVIHIVNNSGWSSETVSIMTPLGTVSVKYAVDFADGSTLSATAENIAEALRKHQVLSQQHPA